MKNIASVLASLLALQPVTAYQTRPTFSIDTNVVIVNVTVLDRNGKPIPNLGTADFEVYEDGKLQKLQAVDYQQLSEGVLPPLTDKPPAPPPAPKGYNPDAEKAALKTSLMTKYQDRRLMVILFDFSSMQPAEQIRARNAAVKFLTSQMTASDSVSIMLFTSELKTVQDFTSDRDLLIATINKFRVGESSENASVADEGADAQDVSGSFVADETEFNIFNSDLKLAALEDAARKLGEFPEKKALIYISSGIQKNGVDNQSQLRATVNTAIRSNVAFYPIDARGLSALVPGGDATQAGAVGNNLYNGAGQNTIRSNFNNQQETLATLALDTGGKALLDSNDLTEGIRQVQQDFSSYYVLSYVSSNASMDGRYRRIQVKLSPKLAGLRAKLDYRQGYYGSTTFAHMAEGDKEAQLEKALLSDNPVTDLPIAVEVDYFRMEKTKYFVPIGVKIPGSALALRKKGAKQATELEFIAQVYDDRNRSAATVRDTIPLKLTEDVAGQVLHKSLQYDTGVTLTPGKYRLRFVARENGEGKVGTYEVKFVVPDVNTEKTLRVSSVILSNQRDAVASQVGGVKNSKKLIQENPLIADGKKLVPNVTKVFRVNQNMLVYVEVYDPNIPDFLPENFKRADVTASLALYKDDKKIFESPAVRANRLADNRDATLPVWLQMSMAKVPPGTYDAQVNLIDEFGKKFAFPRTNLAVLSPEAAPATPALPTPWQPPIVWYNRPMRIGYSRRPEEQGFPGRQLLIAASGISAVLLSTWGLETTISKPKVDVAGVFNSHPKTDPRTVRLKKFLNKLHCPVAYLSEEFVRAADDNHLDWRLLPSIAIIESGGGKAYIREKNNIFGWGGGEIYFDSVRAGLQTVAYELGRGSLYRRHNSLGKLHLYNPDENYAQQVMAVMRRISPVVKLGSEEEIVKIDGEYVYLNKASADMARR